MRTLATSFRPAREPRGGVVVTGFGTFPGVGRNATADIVHAIARTHRIALDAPSRRVPDFEVGRGSLRLPSGRAVPASLMVLPVAWDAAADLVVKETRAAGALLVVMNGVAAPEQPIFVEEAATSARVARPDAYGVSPRRASAASRVRPATLAVDVARDAAVRALAAEKLASVPGAIVKSARPDNAYVCNATAYRVARAQRLGAEHGFVHWPKDIARREIAGCARVLVAMIDALWNA